MGDVARRSVRLRLLGLPKIVCNMPKSAPFIRRQSPSGVQACESHRILERSKQRAGLSYSFSDECSQEGQGVAPSIITYNALISACVMCKRRDCSTAVTGWSSARLVDCFYRSRGQCFLILPSYSFSAATRIMHSASSVHPDERSWPHICTV